MVPAFGRMFAAVDTSPPWGTQLLLELAAVVRDYALLLPSLVVLAPAPLLRLDWKHERTIRAARATAGLAAFGTIGGGCSWR